jgi:hypothetical protein
MEQRVSATARSDRQALTIKSGWAGNKKGLARDLAGGIRLAAAQTLKCGDATGPGAADVDWYY